MLEEAFLQLVSNSANLCVQVPLSCNHRYGEGSVCPSEHISAFLVIMAFLANQLAGTTYPSSLYRSAATNEHSYEMETTADEKHVQYQINLLHIVRNLSIAKACHYQLHGRL